MMSLLNYLLNYLLAYLLNRRSGVILEKLTDSTRKLVTTFPAFCGNLRVITVFTSARHLSLS